MPQLLGLCPAHFGRNPATNRRQISYADPFFLAFSETKIMKSKTDSSEDFFFEAHFFLGTKIKKLDVDSM